MEHHVGFVQSKGYFAQFKRFKDLKSNTCKAVPLEWQLQLSFEVVLFVLFFTVLIILNLPLRFRTLSVSDCTSSGIDYLYLTGTSSSK